MMSENEFVEFVEAVCNRPKMYSPTGTFYEVVSFLEGYAAGANVGNLGYHFVLSPFRKWVAQKFQIRSEIIDWNEFRGLFTTDSEAMRNLLVLYKEYVTASDIEV